MDNSENSWMVGLSGVLTAAILSIYAAIQWIRNHITKPKEDRELPSWKDLDQSNQSLRAEAMKNIREIQALRDEFNARLADQQAKGLELVDKIDASTRVFRQVEDQWPPEHNPPEIDPDDAEVLGEILPVNWRYPRDRPAA